MSEDRMVLAIDQGTTSSRAILFDRAGSPCASARIELPQIYPRSGWVEHDGRRIWQDSLKSARAAIAEAGIDAEAIDAVGITNQRETTLLWDRASGEPLHNAIVWQDRRTDQLCRRLKDAGHEPDIQRKSGLLLDPYFSATKLAWLLDNVDGARAAADRGELAFGTVDCWLLWHLTGAKVHATDVTNAARTMLFNIHDQDWDDDLLALFGVPRSVLPEVRDCSGPFGDTDPALFGRAIPITGIAGDQQAATFGQAAFEPGMIKSTYGTGCFALLNTGNVAVASTNRLLTTIAWRLGGETTYALEGSIFIAGAAVQWLRDGLRLIRSAAETEALAASIEDTGGVYLVPAFVGLGAPHWDAAARGALVGLTRDSGVAEIARAALEAVCYQTRDLMGAMAADGAALGHAAPLAPSAPLAPLAPLAPKALRVDGGMVINDWAMQFLSDLLDLPVDRPVVTETTALGAAYLAGLETGFYGGTDEIAANWQCDRTWRPNMPAARREALYAGWQEAVGRVASSRS